MRKKKHTRARRRPSYGPSPAAWTFLIVCWIAVAPLSLFVFRTAEAESVDLAPVMLQTAPDTKNEPLSVNASIEPICDAGSLRGSEPKVLIYHTHTTEAYFKTTEDEYAASSAWRTRDPEHNVVAVGEELKTILETQYGVSVIHDVTDHEPPKLATSYERSLETMLMYRKRYPSIVLFIDLHRDAYSEADEPCDYIVVNGEECARLMFVVGKGEKYDEKPFYTTNLSLAERITERLNAIDPSFARKIRIKSGRYNQHVAPNCILVEVGHNANTLDQAKHSMQYLAECIALSFRSGRIDPADWTPN